MTSPDTSPRAEAKPARAPRRATVIAVASLLGATLFWAGNYVVGAGAVCCVGPWPSFRCW
jgi:hypothetical protein